MNNPDMCDRCARIANAYEEIHELRDRLDVSERELKLYKARWCEALYALTEVDLAIKQYNASIAKADAEEAKRGKSA